MITLLYVKTHVSTCACVTKLTSGASWTYSFIRKFFFVHRLIFISQPNLVVEPGVHPTLHPNCHHKIVFAKFNLMIFYHLPISENSGIIEEQILTLSEEQSITSIGKKPTYCNTNVTKKVSIFYKTILNVLRKYIPHET